MANKIREDAVRSDRDEDSDGSSDSDLSLGRPSTFNLPRKLVIEREEDRNGESKALERIRELRHRKEEAEKEKRREVMRERRKRLSEKEKLHWTWSRTIFYYMGMTVIFFDVLIIIGVIYFYFN